MSERGEVRYAHIHSMWVGITIELKCGDVAGGGGGQNWHALGGVGVGAPWPSYFLYTLKSKNALPIQKIDEG